MRLEPLFEERFERQGNVSFNCRKGYGTEAAVQHAAEGMREISNGYRENAWVFKGDLSGFCKGCETYRFRRECIDGMGSIFWKYFYVRGRYRCIRAKHRYRAISV